MLKYKTARAWFSRLLQHPVRKQSGSILTTPETTRGKHKHKILKVTTNTKVLTR